MRKICRSSQFMTKILSGENVYQISAVPTGVYVRIWTLPSHVKVLWVVSFPRSKQLPTLMGVLASVCTPSAPLPTRKQQLPTSSAQQCWEFLHPFAHPAHHCQHGSYNFQRRRPNNVGSSYARLLELIKKNYRLTSRPTSPRPTGNA